MLLALEIFLQKLEKLHFSIFLPCFSVKAIIFILKQFFKKILFHYWPKNSKIMYFVTKCVFWLNIGFRNFILQKLEKLHFSIFLPCFSVKAVIFIVKQSWAYNPVKTNASLLFTLANFQEIYSTEMTNNKRGLKKDYCNWVHRVLHKSL